MNAKGSISIRDEVRLRTPTSTRLIRRGLQLHSATDETPLVVVSFAANEESIYVMSLDWDADAFPRSGSTALGVHNDYSGMWDHIILPAETYEQWTEPTPYQWDNEKRSVILYEFDYAGSFQKKLTLPLIRLKPERQSHIRARRPGKPIVGAGNVIFHEFFRIRGWSRLVRLDYIFDMRGALLAVWSNESFFDKFRLESEPHVPYSTVMKPRWMVGENLVCCQPEGYRFSRHDLMCDLSLQYFQGETHQREHTVGVIQIDGMVHSCHSVEGIDVTSLFPEMLPITEFLEEPAQLYRSQFPEPSAFVAHKTYQNGWDMDAANDEAVWFFHKMNANSDWFIWYMQIVPSVSEPVEIEVEPPLEELLQVLREDDVELYDLIKGIADSTVQAVNGWVRSWYSFMQELNTHGIELLPSNFSVHDDFVCVEWSLHQGGHWKDFWTRYWFVRDIYSVEPTSTFTIGSDSSRTIEDLVLEEWGAPLPRSGKDAGWVAKCPYYFDNHTANENLLVSRFVTRDSAGKPIISARTGVVMTDIATGQEKCFIPRVPTEMMPKVQLPDHVEY